MITTGNWIETVFATAAPALLCSMLELQAQDATARGTDAPAGDEFVITHVSPPPARGKPEAPKQTVCWLAKDCPYVRGVIVGHPMIADLATEARFRRVAAEEGLGTVMLNAFREPGTSWEQLDRVLD